MSRALRTDVAPSTDTIVRFKDEKPFDVRQVESRRVREKYPDLIPVICERADNSDLPDTTRRKYLVPQALTMGQFMYVLRRRINLDANRAMFLFIDNNTLAPSAELVSSVFEDCLL